jgi:predicted transcriptional regulator
MVCLKKNEKILELELRNKIFLLVKKYAGSHIRELERISKIPYSTLKYHLHYLVKHELILEKQSNGKSRYYSKSVGLEDISILELMKHKNIRRILFYLTTYEEGTYSDLESFTNLSSTTLIWYMKRLQNKGIVKKEKRRGMVTFRLYFDKEKIIKVLIIYKESFFDSLINRAIEVWDIA